MRVTVDISEYERGLREYVDDYVRGMLAKPTPDEEDVLRRVREVLGPRTPANPERPGWPKEVWTLLDADLERAMTERGPDGYRAFRRDLIDLSSDVFDLRRDKAKDVESAQRQFKELLGESQATARWFAGEINAAIGRVPNWGSSPVTVEPKSRDYTDPVSDFDVTVGRNEAGFGVWTDGKQIKSVDDVLEGGDEDFFHDPREQADYFNLVKELRHPGSSSRGRDRVLWTARPVKDRARYERAKTIPSNLFLTTDADRALGLAQEGELGGGIRDVWRVVVNEIHLVKTLEAGRIVDYQAVGDGPVPVKAMNLVHPAPDTQAGRIAARYIARRG